MTEVEWLHGVKLTPMMNWLRRRGTQRQFYLAGCAAIRAIEDQLPDPKYAELIALVEQYADGLVAREQLSRVYRCREAEAFEEHLALQNQGLGSRRRSRQTALIFAAVHAAMPEEAWCAAISGMATATAAGKRSEIWPQQCAILRDIFGNPFQPVPRVNPAWLTWREGTVARIAQALYEQRSFDQLPILADALQDAGCENVVFLNHCRLPGLHVRGCWLLDLLLGKNDSSQSPAQPSRTGVRPGRNQSPRRRRQTRSDAIILPMLRAPS
jgi:hypothetical protein